jgi:hypothetical protein
VEASAVLVAGEVRGDPELVAVDAEVVGALAAVVERRPPGARLVPLPRPLDLEHVGPQVAEEHGAVGTREDTTEVEHAHAV